MKFYNIKTPTEILFDNKVELLPSVTESFEYELAYLEYKSLPKKEYLERSAFAKSYENKFSNHFLQYSESSKSLTENRSSLTSSYFESGIFSTGYATHGLFPYRGKFHPQLIKALINILGIKKDEIILDPMAGSGTLNIEAALLGINSYAIDVSPFCQLMIKTKYDALSIDLKLLKKLPLKPEVLFELFGKKNALKTIQTLDEDERKIYSLAFLAFLDSLGYSKRVVRSNHEQLFLKVLDRYIETVKNYLENRYNNKHLGTVSILQKSSALDTKLDKESVDAIITSPPYSFAIDYIENDKDQLELLGYDTSKLKENLIGLKGKTKTDKLELYFKDMDKFCCEASKVLREKKYLIIIIGSNTNQTGGIRLEHSIIESAKKYGLELVKSILKPIKGLRSTMKDEYILIFEKV